MGRSLSLPSLPTLPSFGRLKVPKLPRPQAPQRSQVETAPDTPARQQLALLGVVATEPEARVLQWLVKRGYQAGTDFAFQSELLGGRAEVGGTIADLVIWQSAAAGPMGLVVRVQGEYWHYTTAGQRQKDWQQRELLEQEGFAVVDVDEHDVYERIDWIMDQALRGVDHSRGARER